MSGDRRRRVVCWIRGHVWTFRAVDRRTGPLYTESWFCDRCPAARTVKRHSAVLGEIPPPAGGLIDILRDRDRWVYAAVVVVILAIAGGMIAAALRVGP
jgi:hypothetical protein